MVLTVAGSDPSGGAGIQADLKTFSALGAYGCAVLTALTAQNTRGVTGVHAVPAAFVTQQLRTLLDDVALDAVKIGMVADAGIARALAAALPGSAPHLVLDPVMVATSGDRLLTPDAEAVVRDELVPLAGLITPNLAEAGALLGRPPAGTADEATDQVHALLAAGARRVLLKGGHRTDELGGGGTVVDLYGEPGHEVVAITAPRVDTRNTHGTGCTLSAAIAALRPVSPDWLTAVRRAKDYLTRALQGADQLQIGRVGPDGHGPVHHFAGIWNERKSDTAG
ncbi:hydroxymethylpyrimidine/phosphomethylpyrimidine kinase [Nakamurella flavida]|uniref:bifunctional hydroxymethylpyrimidine kinase/phosphomethylpyrimidine kinase n=1 Tax=Nakamurella flavida TaxID=363630 RepID=UPI002786DE08|nr:bifunctional hydroxymethylpyrimidine kinase/phosphomethylpyrimidine kinase [Nakamurella flavida]MDP9779550.1 hydroxymethylpyrimidine/phosphomethylpyrimidine kinase [Nakamurella flavida]